MEEGFGSVVRVQGLKGKNTIVEFSEAEAAEKCISAGYTGLAGMRIKVRPFYLADKASENNTATQASESFAYLHGLPLGTQSYQLRAMLTLLEATHWTVSQYLGGNIKACWAKVYFASEQECQQAAMKA
jgi:hypothetical protein